jgi:hypothetical protein
MKSPNREKELMVTLTLQDQDRLGDDMFLKLLTGQNQQNKGKNAASVTSKVASNCGLYAVPVSKKLPWMTLSNIP